MCIRDRLGGDTAILDIGILAQSTRTITVTQTIPVGGLATIQVTGLLSAQVLKTYTLSVDTIIGNTNDDHTNDSATQYLTGISAFGIIAGYCGSKQSVKTAHQHNLATFNTLSSSQKRQFANKVAAHG